MAQTAASTLALFTQRPDAPRVGDVIPFFDEGQWHIFCLTPPPGTLYFPDRLQTTWRHLRSTDLITWEELPPALVPGPPGDPDCDGIWTGSVLRAGDVYHIFYTGHALDSSTPQTVCHATSSDGLTWVKDPANPISTPDLERFESDDWRDPFVFWNEIEQRWWMLLSTRSAQNPAVSRGVVALQRSDDLVSWDDPEELYESFLTHCPECPELFRLGDRWVLAYSRFTDRRGTVYRHADDPRGPWRRFAADKPDGAQWYAAKSAFDDRGRRVAFGWVPDRNPAPSELTGPWLWAGDLATPRELRLDARGRLVVRLPDEIGESADPPLRPTPAPGAGAWEVTQADDAVSLGVASVGRFAHCLVRCDGVERAAPYLLSLTVRNATRAATVGLAVQTNDQLDRGAAILLYPQEGRACAIDLAAARAEDGDNYERPTTEYAAAVESVVVLDPDDVCSLQVLVRDDVVEALVGDTATLSYRLPSAEAGVVAVLVDDGTVEFCDITIRNLPHETSSEARRG